MKKVRKRLIVKGNSPIAKVAAFKFKTTAVALVLGRTIHIYGIHPLSFITNENWLAHELVHIKQYERYGIVRFLCLYMWEWIKHGYYKNRFEQEARLAVNQSACKEGVAEYEIELK